MFLCIYIEYLFCFQSFPQSREKGEDKRNALMQIDLKLQTGVLLWHRWCLLKFDARLSLSAFWRNLAYFCETNLYSYVNRSIQINDARIIFYGQITAIFPWRFSLRWSSNENILLRQHKKCSWCISTRAPSLWRLLQIQKKTPKEGRRSVTPFNTFTNSSRKK